MSPSRYLRLQRLNLVRSELRRADPATASVTEIAQRFQFSEPGPVCRRLSKTFRRIAVNHTGRSPITAA
jgi:hypothetical protein